MVIRRAINLVNVKGTTEIRSEQKKVLVEIICWWASYVNQPKRFCIYLNKLNLHSFQFTNGYFFPSCIKS